MAEKRKMAHSCKILLAGYRQRGKENTYICSPKVYSDGGRHDLSLGRRLVVVGVVDEVVVGSVGSGCDDLIFCVQSE